MLIFAIVYDIIIIVFFGGMDYDSFRDGRTETLAQQSPKETAGIERCKVSRFSTFRFTPSAAFCYNTIIVFFNSPTHKLTHSMKKLLLSSIAAIAAATAFADGDIQLSSSIIPLPEKNGSFSDVSSIGYPVRHIYYMISEEEFDAYASAPSPSKAVYNAFLDGNLGEELIYDEVTTNGFSDIYLSEILDEEGFPYAFYYGPGENAYFAAIYTYTNETTGAFYYIAQTTNIVTLTEEEIDALPTPFGAKRWIYDIAVNAGRWEMIAPLEIECTNIAVSGGTVTVTYQVSDLSGFAVGSTVNFSVAYSLARNASGELATETLSGTINSIDATASTFTATLSPPANTTSLFILGIDD